MYAGQLVFAQLMEHLPWQSFRRIVERYGGDHRVRDFSCANQFRCMAFAQLTYRESLRDIATCLRAQSTKLYHLGIRGAVARTTLADANEARDWRIYAEFAQHLIRIARRLYVDEPFGVDLKDPVYALDSTTIDLCLRLFPWTPFRSTKAAIKLHTLIDLRGNIPSFIHIPDGKLHDVNVLDELLPEPGAVPWPGDIDDVEVVLLDDPVEVDVDEIQTGRRAPVAQQARLHMLERQRLLQQRVSRR